jgi:thiamine pyrophosphokinase
MRHSRLGVRAIAAFIGITVVALALATRVQAQCPNFGPATNFTTGTVPASLAIGDFNGDGKSDLAVANFSTNNISILLGTGIGTFGAATNFGVGTAPRSVAIGDFNGDGKSDLAVANDNSNNVSILLGTGTGTFGAATNFAAGTQPFSVAIGDFNGDGKSDLAVANFNFSSNNVSILLGTGTGTFGAATNFAVGANPESVAIGDFNGDGKSDLAVANFGSNNVSILLGTGTGTFGAATNFAVGTNPSSVAIGDFNGDGKSDLAVANQNSNNVSILLGTGTGTFGAATNFATGTVPASVAIGDFNGDGKSDLAVAIYATNNVSILFGTGTGTFGAATNFAVGSGPAFVATGDFNGDGRTDLAVANNNSSNVSILLNATATGTLALSSATYSVNEGAGSVTITVNRTGGTDCSVTVDYATANGSATAGSDYTATSGTLTFGPGITSQTFAVPITDDTLFEGNETFTVTISNPGGGATLGATTSATVTIIDNDAPPTLAINNVTQAEGNVGTTNFVFTVTLTGSTALTTTVNYATANGTATAGSDYTATSGTLTFAPGVTSQTISVPVIGDTVNEADETFTVTLTSPTNATITTATGTGTIQNDDGQPTLSINNVTQAEGNAGTTNFVFTVTLTGSTALATTVNYATANGTATAGSDYTATSGTLTFAPGVTSQTISVPVIGDTVNEADETFTVTLTSPTNATITTATGTGTIQNDDGQPTLSINNVTQAEGNAGTTNFVFTVTLSPASGQTVMVNYATANGTATAGSDYTATSGTLTFAPGVTTQNISVPVNGDTVFEPDETFTVNLSAPVNAMITTATGTGTIVNDEPGNADVAITKTASGNFFAGQNTTFNIAITNGGPNNAAAVIVTDVLPAGVTFVSATPTQGSCNGTTTVTCDLGTMNNAGSASIALTVRLDNPGALSNTATVSTAPQPDPNPANNTSTAQVIVLPASAIPMLDEKTLILLAALLATLGVWVIGRK